MTRAKRKSCGRTAVVTHTETGSTRHTLELIQPLPVWHLSSRVMCTNENMSSCSASWQSWRLAQALQPPQKLPKSTSRTPKPPQDLLTSSTTKCPWGPPKTSRVLLDQPSQELLDPPWWPLGPEILQAPPHTFQALLTDCWSTRISIRASKTSSRYTWTPSRTYRTISSTINRQGIP